MQFILDLKSDKIGGFLLRTLLRTERMTSIILGSSMHLSNNLLAWHILRNILFTYFRSKHLMMRTQKFFFWAFLVFINISIGRISLGVLCSCCSPFKIQQCHHSPHFFLEEYPFTVIIFPSFLLSFDNNGIRFLWNPLPYTKFRFIYNPPTFQKESLKGLWIGLTELVFSQMRLRMVQSLPRQIFGLHNTNMTSIFVSYLQYDSI